MHQALKAHGFRYDASDVAAANRWPEKSDGIWRFNLASLRITYRELADLLDGFDRRTLQAFQRGDFPRAPQPSDLAAGGARERL